MPDSNPPGGSGNAASAVPALAFDAFVGGGFTRGALVPPAALERARTHRLRTIGAAPGGAVAAALIAAAEYGRERYGFGKLAALERSLADGTAREALFAAEAPLRPLLAWLRSLERRAPAPQPGPGPAGLVATFWSWFPAWVRWVFDVVPGSLRDALPWHYWIATVLGGVAGGTIDVLLAKGLVDASHPLARSVVAIVLPVMFVGCWVASVGACAGRLWRILAVDVPANGYGLCTGLESARSADAATPPFTRWLHERIQELAGLPTGAPPLTLGALRSRRVNGGTEAAPIVTVMPVASPLPGAQGAPADAEALFVREDEWRRLFPPEVVAHVVESARAAAPGPARADGLLPLAAPDELPLVALARMSLALPLRLAPVPVHVARPAGTAPRRVRVAGAEEAADVRELLVRAVMAMRAPDPGTDDFASADIAPGPGDRA